MILVNSYRRILYNLSESNSNNPVNLLVGQDVTVYEYDDNNNIIDKFVGELVSITNTTVIIKDYHTQENYDFVFVGFNAHENAAEFISTSGNYKFFDY